MKRFTGRTRALGAVAFAAMLVGCGASVSPGGDGGSEASTVCGDMPIGGCAFGSPDSCGDVEVSPTCTANGWQCPSGSIPISQCHCFGLPPVNCRCTASGWSCTDAGVSSVAFQCGDRACTHGDEYCSVTLDDTGGPNVYACLPIPTACNGIATCECIAMMPAGPTCVNSALGDVTVTTGGG